MRIIRMRESASPVSAKSRDVPPEIDEALRQLSVDEYIQASPTSSIVGEAEYHFWHAVVRDVAYAELPRAARADRHRRAVEWIETVSTGRVEDLAEILAHHYITALDLSIVLKDPDSGLLRGRAIHYLELAGDRASELDPSKAESFYRRALELEPASESQVAFLDAKLAKASARRDLRTAANEYELATAVFQRTGDRRREAQALGGLARIQASLGATADALVTATRAMSLIRGAGVSPEVAEAYMAAAGSESSRDKPARSCVGQSDRSQWRVHSDSRP